MLSRRSFLAVPCAMAVGAAVPAEGANYPIRLGVDDARLARDNPPARVDRLFEILKELGLTHVDIHLNPITNAGDKNAALMAKTIERIDRQVRERGMTYTLNVERPNSPGGESAEITPGVNEFDHPGGLHHRSEE